MLAHLQDDDQALVDRHRGFFQAVEGTQPAALAFLLGVATRKQGDALEGAEVHIRRDAPVAGPMKRHFQVVAAEVPEIGPLHQRAEVAEQVVQPPLALLGIQCQQAVCIVVGIEWGIGVFQLLQALVVLPVKCCRDPPAELADQVAVRRLEVRIGAEQIDQLAAADGDEVLAILVYGHLTFSCTPPVGRRLTIASKLHHLQPVLRRLDELLGQMVQRALDLAARSGRPRALNARQRWISSHSGGGASGAYSCAGLNRRSHTLASTMAPPSSTETVGGGRRQVNSRYIRAPKL